MAWILGARSDDFSQRVRVRDMVRLRSREVEQKTSDGDLSQALYTLHRSPLTTADGWRAGTGLRGRRSGGSRPWPAAIWRADVQEVTARVQEAGRVTGFWNSAGVEALLDSRVELRIDSANCATELEFRPHQPVVVHARRGAAPQQIEVR